MIFRTDFAPTGLTYLDLTPEQGNRFLVECGRFLLLPPMSAFFDAAECERAAVFFAEGVIGVDARSTGIRALEDVLDLLNSRSRTIIDPLGDATRYGLTGWDWPRWAAWVCAVLRYRTLTVRDD